MNLGRLSPNLVLLGFKNSWGDDAASTAEYFNVVNHAIDLKLAVAILRVKNGLDYSDIISQEEAIGIEEEIDGTINDFAQISCEIRSSFLVQTKAMS